MRHFTHLESEFSNLLGSYKHNNGTQIKISRVYPCDTLDCGAPYCGAPYCTKNKLELISDASPPLGGVACLTNQALSILREFYTKL
jgi:hypothetical protein